MRWADVMCSTLLLNVVTIRYAAVAAAAFQWAAVNRFVVCLQERQFAVHAKCFHTIAGKVNPNSSYYYYQ